MYQSESNQEKETSSSTYNRRNLTQGIGYTSLEEAESQVGDGKRFSNSRKPLPPLR